MKGKVLELLRSRSNYISIEELSEFTATSISEELFISRNLASQYLNEHVLEKKVIKITGRPVYFFEKSVVEKIYNVNLRKDTFSLTEFLEIIRPKKDEIKDFNKLIGFDGSLSYNVEQCKAAITYPPHGLPILFYGPTGTGKSFMAQLMHEYAINNGIIDKDKKLVIVNCAEFTNNPELLTANLFGSKKGAYTGADKDNVGLLRIADGGILFLDEIHCLKPECQEKLFLFMDKGIYHMVGDNETWYESKVRLVFATTENPQEVLLKTLLRRIAIISTIPSLEERHIEERKALIYHIFKSESNRIGIEIRISNAVYKMLLNGKFTGNIGHIKNLIRAGCANAFLKYNEDDKYLGVSIYNMPQYLINESLKDNINVESTFDKKMIDIEQINPKNIKKTNSKIVSFYEDIIKEFNIYLENRSEFTKVVDKYYILLEKLYDNILYLDSVISNQKIEYITKILQNIFDIVNKQYKLEVYNNDIIAYAKFLNDYIESNSNIVLWEKYNKDIVKRFNEECKLKYSREYHIALEINKLIDNSLDIALSDMELSLLAINIKSYNKEIDINRVPGIILSHGYSTASSIADAVNKLIGNYVFDAIDMPLGVSTEEIIEKVKVHINRIGNVNELILLVDMGSLEDIYSGIQRDINIDIGIVNNITTRLALDIGFKLVQGVETENILKEACESNYSTYKYIKNRKREKAIIAVCPSGLGTSKKIAELINKSLPKNIEVNIFPCDYGVIIDESKLKGLMDKFEIELIIGTINPNINNIPFISLENIITNQKLEELESILENYLTVEEFAQFKKNIIKTFSLSNILNYLTILSPEKVLDVVEEVVCDLERRLNIKLKSNIKIGLYIHMSCLIERLITKSYITTYFNIEDFKKNNQEFIDIVRESANPIETYFSVEIPVEEMGYIYDYINNNE